MIGRRRRSRARATSRRVSLRSSLFVSLLSSLLLTACFANADDALPRAPALRDPMQLGRLEHPGLTEMSGLARSVRHTGLLWSHNDSGNDPMLFAIDSTGGTRGEWRVTDARNNDWEAIGVGPCDAPSTASCVYLADVGDNQARRDSPSIWRVAEPALDSLATSPAARLRFRYPDEAHDVEGMWVAPDTSVWLVTKRAHRNAKGEFRQALVFRLPAGAWRADTTGERYPVAELVDSLPLVPVRQTSDGWITDASLAGARLAVRTYRDVYVFEANAETGRPGRLIARCALRGIRERYGESVVWLDGERLLFGEEGRRSGLWQGRCP